MKNKDTIKEILKLADELLSLSRCGFEDFNTTEYLIFFGLVRDCAFKIKKFAESNLSEEKTK